jgi:hypothetical protein
MGCAWADAGVLRATTALRAHRALRAMYWKQRCELSGEAMPVDVPAGLPSNAFVLKMMRNADATLKKVRPRDTPPENGSFDERGAWEYQPVSKLTGRVRTRRSPRATLLVGSQGCGNGWAAPEVATFMYYQEELAQLSGWGSHQSVPYTSLNSSATRESVKRSLTRRTNRITSRRCPRSALSWLRPPPPMTRSACPCPY